MNDKDIEKSVHKVPSKLLRLWGFVYFFLYPITSTQVAADRGALRRCHRSIKKWRIDNYRPVWVLPHYLKFMTEPWVNNSMNFLDKIFSALLSAFRKRYSCQSTLLKIIEHLQKKSLDNGEYVACLSMDLSQAFGCLPRCITICLLHSYGVSREACTSIESYLWDRKQWIKLGNSRSVLYGRNYLRVFLKDLYLVFWFSTFF